MMIKSMTGYGRGCVKENGRSFTVEIKSVNNRYLDVYIRLQRQISALEDRIRKYVSTRISRGKVDIYISQDKFSEEDIEINLDENVARAYYNSLCTLKEKFKLKDDITLSMLVDIPDVLKIEKKEEDKEEIWKVIHKATDEALNMFVDMRSSEGLKLSKDISERCDFIQEKVVEIEEKCPVVVDEYRERIRERVSEYLKEIEIDESKLLNEVAFFSDKVNITEEIVRLKSHLVQMKKTLTIEEPVGRKLDFLIQEMNREINTIGSKSSDLFITNLVVDIKSELEKIREQVQNIE